MLSFHATQSAISIYYSKTTQIIKLVSYVRRGEGDKLEIGVPPLLELWPFICVSLESWRCSNDLTTPPMFGLSFGSVERHWIARWAILFASRFEYCPSIRASITWEILCLFIRSGFAHSTRLCSPLGLLLSNARFPDISSRRTTPKLYMSLLFVRWPSKHTQFEEG